MGKMSETQFYCVSCRDRKTAKKSDICCKMFNNSRSGDTPALIATCPSCGQNLTKWVKRDSFDKMCKKYGKC
jgi:hypothetical protein